MSWGGGSSLSLGPITNETGVIQPGRPRRVWTVESVVLEKAQVKTVHGQPFRYVPMLVFDKGAIQQRVSTPATSRGVTDAMNAQPINIFLANVYEQGAYRFFKINLRPFLRRFNSNFSGF